ncbi:type IVB secretion system protein IcmG/DotF [Legionella fairfieldensis]|uniref:type IVB secretion system protein IcmG/DotF n=1 Tax=Legionella fairfieldensis TaxID=45064 RepID=UPI00048EAF8C|nr:type IVB secretion system protein IcmG/DotF [Legionella fairfieldensis]
MADNDQYNDEYQFADLDVISPDSLGGEEGTSRDEPTQEPVKKGGTTIKRNALIVIGLVVLSMLGYKFLGSFFTGKPSDTQEKATVPPMAAVQTQQTPPPAVVAPAPVAPPPVIQSSPDNSQFTQKLSALEMGQQNVRSEVNSVNTQLNGINTNVNELTEKIADLNRMLTVLAEKVDQQSSKIAVLTERAKPRPVRRPMVARRVIGPVYYIQAVIPGRAWLIATNGSTLTVREGTQIAGYGIVKLIDPNQGRVLTSSGRVIRFSPQDS